MTELGQIYRDVASRFVGVATGRAEYLGAGVQIQLTAQKGTETVVEVWVHEGRLEPADERQPGFA